MEVSQQDFMRLDSIYCSYNEYKELSNNYERMYNEMVECGFNEEDPQTHSYAMSWSSYDDKAEAEKKSFHEELKRIEKYASKEDVEEVKESLADEYGWDIWD